MDAIAYTRREEIEEARSGESLRQVPQHIGGTEWILEILLHEVDVRRPVPVDEFIAHKPLDRFEDRGVAGMKTVRSEVEEIAIFGAMGVRHATNVRLQFEYIGFHL